MNFRAKIIDLFKDIEKNHPILDCESGIASSF